MNIECQDRNNLYQLYRKDEMQRLNKKIQRIKNRKPLMPMDNNQYSFPKIKHNRSQPYHVIQRINLQNKRLNQKIIKNMRKSQTNRSLVIDSQHHYKSPTERKKLEASITQINKIYQIDLRQVLQKNQKHTQFNSLKNSLYRSNKTQHYNDDEDIYKKIRKYCNSNLQGSSLPIRAQLQQLKQQKKQQISSKPQIVL